MDTIKFGIHEKKSVTSTGIWDEVRIHVGSQLIAIRNWEIDAVV